MRGCRWLVLAAPLAAGLGLVVLAAADDTDEKADEKPKYTYIGVKACARLCHRTKKQGEQLGKWESLKHSKAYELLKSDEAKAVGKKVGLQKPPHESPECLKCHATGYDLPKERMKSRFKIEDGVQCETCHGPGEKYKPKAVMQDREKAISLGLVIGDEKLCRTCHNDKSPTWKPDRYTTKDGKKVGFDYEQAWKKIAHYVPKEED